MSFPNIPDINPYINIKFEDAINLLLTSVAMEEVSLSKLMDAETDKIKCIIDDYKHKSTKCNHYDHKDSTLQDVIEVNKSVDDTIKNMIKLQMLLQFKLENIEQLVSKTSTTSTTTTSTSTTTTCTKTKTHTTTSTTSTCSTTTKKIYHCSLAGTGRGCVSNSHDAFYNCMSILCTLLNYDENKKDLKYSVRNNIYSLFLNANSRNLKLHCPCHCSDTFVVHGTGDVRIYKQYNPFYNSIYFNGQMDFKLTVCNKAEGLIEYRMEVSSECHPKLNHDSGFIRVNKMCSNLQLKICCGRC